MCVPRYTKDTKLQKQTSSLDRPSSEARWIWPFSYISGSTFDSFSVFCFFLLNTSENCSADGVKEQIEVNRNTDTSGSMAFFFKLSVQLWRAAGGALEVFNYFSILWNCITILECWSTPCSYMVSKMWSHYGGGAGYYFLWFWQKVYCDHSLKNFAIVCKSGWNNLKSTIGLFKEKKSRIDDSWSHMWQNFVCVCVCVYSIYIYEYNLSVVKGACV